MPNQPRADNPHRMVRVDDALWTAAKARASESSTTVSAVIRDALQAFVGDREAVAVERVRSLCRENQTEAIDGTLTDADTIAPSDILAALDTPPSDGWSIPRIR